MSTAHTEEHETPCPSFDAYADTGEVFPGHSQPEYQAQDHTSENLFPELKLDLNYDDTNSSDAFFPSDNIPMPDLPLPDSTIDVDQIDFMFDQPPTLAGSPLFSSSASMTPQTLLETVPSTSASMTPQTLLETVPSTSASMTPQTPLERVPSASASMTPQTPLETVPSASASQASTLRAFSDPSGSHPVRTVAIPRARTSTLQRHKKSQVRVACTRGCPETFVGKKERRRHESSVHDRQDPECPRCGRKCRKDNIRRHMRKKHKLNEAEITLALQDTCSRI